MNKLNLTHSMRRLRLLLIEILALSILCVVHTYGGTLFYNAIPATESDANSGSVPTINIRAPSMGGTGVAPIV